MDICERNNASLSGECKALFEACTPQLYLRNAFRITGLPVFVSTREAKRRIDELKAAEEAGEGASEYTHAFALSPPPSLELLREASMKLQDPLHRIVDEFFWFWPLDWQEPESDLAINYLTKGDNSSASHVWSTALDATPQQRAIAKHNLGVLAHLKALDVDLAPDSSAIKTDTSKFWRICLDYWQNAREDDVLWRVYTERIRSLKDPQLTTGLVRRIREALPEAILRINCLLALRQSEAGRETIAHDRLRFVHASGWDTSAVQGAVSAITGQTRARITNAIERTIANLKQQTTHPKECATQLHRAIKSPLSIIDFMYLRDNPTRNDVFDAVAETYALCARNCDDIQSACEVMSIARDHASSAETTAHITKEFNAINSALTVEKVADYCISTVKYIEGHPYEGKAYAERLLSEVPGKVRNIAEIQTSRLVLDYMAGAINSCIVKYGNVTGRWQECAPILNQALQLVSDPDLNAVITENLRTALSNVDARPASSTTSCLSSIGSLLLQGLAYLVVGGIILLIRSCIAIIQ